MIYLITGNKGAGKTANLIRFVCEDDQFKGRPAYYINIRKCTVEGWTEIDKEQLQNWTDLPDGSVIIIDEVQKFFTTRSQKAAVPDYIMNLTDSRHRGFSFVTTCQFPTQLDTWFRKLVDIHWHLERPYNIGRIKVFEWSTKSISDPVGDHFARQEANILKWKLPKKYFGSYESASIHVNNTKLPKKLFTVLGFASLAAIGAYFLPSLLLSKDSVPGTKQDISSYIDKAVNNVSNTTTSRPQQTSLLSDLNSFKQAQTPVVPDRPDTAKIYEELQENVVSKPRLQCLYTVTENDLIDKCTCYTQQATRAKISERACVNYVNNGYDFDPTLPDHALEREYRESYGNSAQEGRLAPAPTVTQISSSGSPTFPSASNSFQGIRFF